MTSMQVKQGWHDIVLDDCLSNVIDYRGKTPKKVTQGVKLVTAKIIKGGRILTDSQFEYVESEKYDEIMKRGLPKLEDILITTEAPLGELAMIKTDEKIAIAQRVILLRADRTKADPYFLFYNLQSPLSQGRLKARATGTTVLGIKNPELRKIKIYLPPLSVQQKIASILSAFDDLIENNTKRIKTLENTAQLIYKEWFVDFKFPGHEKVKMVPVKTETIHELSLREIPEGWEVKELGERVPVSKMKRDEMKGMFPYYGAAKVIDWVNDYLFEGKYLLIAEDGSVITPDKKPVLQFVNEKFWVSNHAHILQGKLFSTEYLYLFLSNLNISGFVTGSAQPKINQANLNRIKIIVPYMGD